MKRIATALLILLSSYNLFALNAEEENTVYKLASWNIANKHRSYLDFYKPMRTIDVLSLNIKSISYGKEYTNKEILRSSIKLEDAIRDNQFSINHLKQDSEGLYKIIARQDQELIKRKKEYENDKALGIGMFIVSLIVAVIF